MKGGDSSVLRSLRAFILFISRYINRLTGPAGFRVLSHQFYTSSLLLQENCITSSKTFSLRMKKPREALLQFYNNGGQDQEIWHMVYPLQNGRLSYNVCLRRKNLSEQLRMTMASLMKRYGVLFVLRIAAKRSILEQIC